MILAEELEKYTEMTRYDLVEALARNGYTGASFESVRFLGITNSGNFCYRVTFWDDAGTGVETGKVYVSKNATGDAVAEY